MGLDPAEVPPALDRSPMYGTAATIVRQEDATASVGTSAHVLARRKVDVIGKLVIKPGLIARVGGEDSVDLFGMSEDAIALAEVAVDPVLTTSVELDPIAIFDETTGEGHALWSHSLDEEVAVDAPKARMIEIEVLTHSATVAEVADKCRARVQRYFLSSSTRLA